MVQAEQVNNAVESQFNQIASVILAETKRGEHLALTLSGETSQFIRFNASRVRQTGVVEEIALALDLIVENRQACEVISLSGVLESDLNKVRRALVQLRSEVAQLPEDPYVVLPVGMNHSRSVQFADLPRPDHAADRLLPAMQGLNLSGIWASGRNYRGHINSAGSRHWFTTDSFSLDYSLLNTKEKMVKAVFSGTDWLQSSYEKSLQDSSAKLRMLQQPAIRIRPGHYRAYIASAGVADLLALFSWHGLSECAMQTGESAFSRMRQNGEKLSPLFSLAEDFRNGLVPRFNDRGEISPEHIDLIRAGELKHCLCSSRTAREFGVESNFANDSESLRLPVMSAGSLQEKEILSALDTGVYLSNLHYLNWSDVAGGRITGMTRYACFWVEQGEIQGPIETMRFDDSFYRLFGSSLEAVSTESLINPNVGSYGGRELGMTQCPGILLSSFRLTL